MRGAAGRGHRTVLVSLLVVHAALLAWIGWQTSPNRTEVGQMAAGLYTWHTLRFDVFHVNPPLVRAAATLPAALCSPEVDFSAYSPLPRQRCEWSLGVAFIRANPPDRLRWYFALGRWACVPFGVLGGYACYRLARDLYGGPSGLCALILWCFSPLLLAWGATICPDAPAAGVGVAALWTLRRWLIAPGWPRVLAAGTLLGLLTLVKTTWIIAFGLWPALWLVWRLGQPAAATPRAVPSPSFGQLAAILVLALYVVNLGYGFEGSLRALGEYEFISGSLGGEHRSPRTGWPVPANRFAGTWLGRLPVPIPANMLQGIDTQRYDFERGDRSYLRGEWSERGWWHYHLYALLLKVPLGTWCLVVLALGVTVFSRRYNAAWRDEAPLLVPALAILALVGSQTGFSAHTRYAIPALPLLLVWASKTARAVVLRRRAVAALTALALAWTVASSTFVYPHCLSYFNELAGGPKGGPRHVLGSNVDWGQDLFYLRDWLDAHPEAGPLRVAVEVPFPPALFDAEPETLPAHPPAGQPPPGGPGHDRQEPAPGWHAIGINRLHDPKDPVHVLLPLAPAAVAGYSIQIYHVPPLEAPEG